MTLKLITFKTNHTILGDVTDKVENNFVNIAKPVQVISVPPSQSNPQGGIAFSPFVEYSEEFKSGGYDIQRADILFISTPVGELENQYNQIFGTGLVVPPKKSIIV